MMSEIRRPIMPPLMRTVKRGEMSGAFMSSMVVPMVVSRSAHRYLFRKLSFSHRASLHFSRGKLAWGMRFPFKDRMDKLSIQPEAEEDKGSGAVNCGCRGTLLNCNCL